jgi:hypothetical protein
MKIHWDSVSLCLISGENKSASYILLSLWQQLIERIIPDCAKEREGNVA